MLTADVGGKGGGRPDLAQGGGTLPAGKALAEVIGGWKKKLREHLAEHD
jgi:alanyl-tRNA synthetase